MKRLIVSADDFGMARSINEGIAKAFREGIVRNINVMPSGDKFYDGLSLLKPLKAPEAGAHLALTEVGPLTSADRIPTLVNKEGRFHKNHVIFFAKLLLNRIDLEEIYIELKGQMDAVKASGLFITSLSSHEHIHMHPFILKIFIRLAKEYGVPAIRCIRGETMVSPVGFKKLYRKAVVSFFENGMAGILAGSGMRYTDNFMGFLDSGNLEEETLIGMLKAMREGTTELVTHPGFLSPEVLDRCIFHRACETDLAALVSKRVKKFIDDHNVNLIGFSGLAAKR